MNESLIFTLFDFQKFIKNSSLESVLEDSEKRFSLAKSEDSEKCFLDLVAGGMQQESLQKNSEYGQNFTGKNLSGI